MPNSRTERRFNPLSGDWVLVSEGRTNRPWNGQVEPNVEQEVAPRYSENCHLCPGNTRVSGHKNTNYSGVYVFENDFPAIARASTESPETDAGKPLYYRSEEEFGECRVVCFSDDHSLTLAQMTTSQIEPVIRCYQDQTDDLLSQPGLTHVQIFENRGAAMGCSNPHPHGQIWAQSRAPSIPARECHAMSSYKRETGSSLLTDYCRDEANSEERVVCANEHFVAVVPYWASWPFEILLLSRRQRSLLTEFDDDEVEAFADLLRRVTVRYDNLFETSFPFSAGIHQMSLRASDGQPFDLHMHFYPPLLRSATVKKFMVGYEMLAEAQRDISPEYAARLLRELPEFHYLEMTDRTMRQLNPSRGDQ